MEEKKVENGGEGIGGWGAYLGDFVEGGKGGARGELLDGDYFRVPVLVLGQEMFILMMGFYEG